MSALTRCPCRASSAASVRVDFVVHRSGDIGSPRSSGSTSPSSAGRSPGSRSATRLRPPPGRRTRPSGASPASSSNTPLRTVVSLTSAACATARMPPCPSSRASAASQQPPLPLVQMREQHRELHGELVTSLVRDAHTTPTSPRTGSNTLMICKPLEGGRFAAPHEPPSRLAISHGCRKTSFAPARRDTIASLRQRDGVSRRQLSQLTGLPASTLTANVAGLLSRGLLSEEDDPPATRQGACRPATTLRIALPSKTLAAIQLGRTHHAVTFVGFDGHIHQSAPLHLDLYQPLSAIATDLAKVLDQYTRIRSERGRHFGGHALPARRR